MASSLSMTGVDGARGRSGADVGATPRLGRLIASLIAGAVATTSMLLSMPTAARAAVEPTLLQLVSGDGQSTTTGDTFGEPCVVFAGGQLGEALVDVDVQFTLDDSTGARFSDGAATASGVTDAQGHASSPLVISGEPGTVTVSASAGSVTLDPACILQTNEVVVTQLQIVGGQYQAAPVGGVFAEPLTVRAVDASGNPAAPAGATVRFDLGWGATFEDGATVSTVPLASDATATSAVLVAGATPTTVGINATIQDENATAPTVTFQIEVIPDQELPVPGTLLPLGEDPFTGVAGQQLPRHPVAFVGTAAAVPLEGIEVRFTIVPDPDAPQAGQTATFLGGGSIATAVTDSYGSAPSPPILAGAAGDFTIVTDVPAASQLGTVTQTATISAAAPIDQPDPPGTPTAPVPLPPGSAPAAAATDATDAASRSAARALAVTGSSPSTIGTLWAGVMLVTGGALLIGRGRRSVVVSRPEVASSSSASSRSRST